MDSAGAPVLAELYGVTASSHHTTLGDLDGNGSSDLVATHNVLGFDRVSVTLNLVGGISQHPANQLSEEGQDVTFSVETTFPEPVEYRWRHNGRELSDGFSLFCATVAGVTTATLTLHRPTVFDAGEYDVVIRSSCLQLISHSANLLVQSDECLGDLNGSRTIGIDDLTVLLSNFGQPQNVPPDGGDLNCDDAVGLSDLTLLLSVFGTNCP
jgi:hypothetical protein